MRSLLFSVFILLMMAFQNANADWTRIHVSWQSDNLLFVDRTTIRRSGNIAKMWDLADFKTAYMLDNGKASFSRKAEMEYDCNEERARMVAITWYTGKMGNGTVVFSNSNIPDRWRPVAPGGTSEIMLKIACGK